jgi:hypothetical protein
VYLQVALHFIEYQAFLYLINCHFLLQVVQTAKCNSTSEIHKTYYLGFLLLRVAIPIYFRGCPNNFLNLQPRDMTSFVVFVSVQVLLVLSQQIFGPRWFIPRRLLPQQYDYFVTVQGVNEDCAICMVALHEPSLTKHSHLKFYQRRSDSTIMMTPCVNINRG